GALQRRGRPDRGHQREHHADTRAACAAEAARVSRRGGRHMSRDLDAAIAAFRRRHTAVGASEAATRLRLLRSARRRTHRRRAAVAVALVVALLATNPTTWALSTGRLQAGLRAARALVDARWLRGHATTHAVAGPVARSTPRPTFRPSAAPPPAPTSAPVAR